MGNLKRRAKRIRHRNRRREMQARADSYHKRLSLAFLLSLCVGGAFILINPEYRNMFLGLGKEKKEP